MDNKLSVFKIEEGDKYPDADQAPAVDLIDYRIWKHDHSEQEGEKWDPTSKEFLELKNSDDYIGVEGSKFVKSALQKASSMTIVPIFVQLEHTLLPKTPIKYDEENDSPDYDDDTFKGDNLAAIPLPAGKWYYHIIIVHESQSKRKPNFAPPLVSVLRILENGTLVQLLTKVDFGGMGQFKNPYLKKDVSSMTSVTIGRQSYWITSSNSTHPATVPHEDFSVVEAFKLEDSGVQLTVHGEIDVIDPVKISEPLPTFFAVGVVKVDFYSHVFVAILDRVSVQEGETGSRIRVFEFNPLSSSPSEVFSLAYRLDLDAGLYTALHSFERKGVKYLTVSRPGKAIIFEVEANGALEQISQFESDDLSELIPVAASGRAREEVSLVQFGFSAGNVVGKRLHPLAFPWSLDQAAVVSEPLWPKPTDKGTFALQAMIKGGGVIGVHLGLKEGATNKDHQDLGFQIFMFPEVPEFYLDRRLQKEAELYPRLYSIKRVDQATKDKVKNIKDHLEKYVAKSGSVVSGTWKIDNVETAKMTAENLPDDTVVTLRLRDDAKDETTVNTENFRQVLNLDLVQVESKLSQVNTNLGTLGGKTSDLLLKESSSVQIVNTPIVFKEDLTVSGELTLSKTDSGKFKIGTLKNLDEQQSMALDDFKNVYSGLQNNKIISGNTIFKDLVTFNNPVKSSTLSEVSNEKTLIGDQAQPLWPHDQLVTTLSSWGEHFSLSCEILIKNVPPSPWGEILRFTSTENDKGQPGDRIPAILIHNDKSEIHIASQVGTENNFSRGYKIKQGTWTKFDIIQNIQDGKVI